MDLIDCALRLSCDIFRILKALLLWSLSVEEVFYLSFPLLCIALRRDGRLFAFWAFVVAIGPLYRATHSGDVGGFLYAHVACFDGIAIGCCTALLADRPLWRPLAMRATQWLTVAGMTVLYLAWPVAQSHVLGVTGIALCTAVLRWSGKLSYELYLFHLVVLGGLRTLYPPSAMHGNEKLLLLGVYLVLSAALSILIAWGYATPLDRFVKRQWLRASARVPDCARL